MSTRVACGIVTLLEERIGALGKLVELELLGFVVVRRVVVGVHCDGASEDRIEQSVWVASENVVAFGWSKWKAECEGRSCFG